MTKLESLREAMGLYDSFSAYLYSGFESLRWYEQQRLGAVATAVAYREQCAEADGVAVEESVYRWALVELVKLFDFCWMQFWQMQKTTAVKGL